MKRCIACWYYKTFDPRPYIAAPGCTTTAEYTPSAECTHPRLGESAEDNGDGNYLTYPYCEGGTFIPGPAFGCVNWTPKEREETQ